MTPRDEFRATLTRLSDDELRAVASAAKAAARAYPDDRQAADALEACWQECVKEGRRPGLWDEVLAAVRAKEAERRDFNWAQIEKLGHRKEQTP